MSGISAQECVNLILQYIGGVPISGAIKTSVEGSPVAKQAAGGSMSIPGLSAIKNALSGMPAATALSSTFTNPMAIATVQTSSQATALVSATESTWVTTMEIHPGLVTRDVIPSLTGKATIEQVDTLQASLTSLSDACSAHKTFSDNLSGCRVPDYGLGEFGLQQLAATTGSFGSLADKIPASLDQAVGGVKTAINDALSATIKPLNMGSTYSEAASVLSTAMTDVANGPPGTIDAVNSRITGLVASITGTMTDASTAMSRFKESAIASSYVATATGLLTANSTTSASLADMCVQPEARTQILEGVDVFKQQYFVGASGG